MAENNVVRFDGQPERRRTRRYALEQEVRYRVSYRDQISQAGIGRLINISQTSPTELMIQGRVVRSNEKGTASTIEGSIAKTAFQTIGMFYGFYERAYL